jgi:hypothetical protein
MTTTTTQRRHDHPGQWSVATCMKTLVALRSTASVPTIAPPHYQSARSAVPYVPVVVNLLLLLFSSYSTFPSILQPIGVAHFSSGLYVYGKIVRSAVNSFEQLQGEDFYRRELNCESKQREKARFESNQRVKAHTFPKKTFCRRHSSFAISRESHRRLLPIVSLLWITCLSPTEKVRRHQRG